MRKAENDVLNLLGLNKPVVPWEHPNRAARRLAWKNRITVGTLMSMQRTGIVAPNERRIDKKKIESFKRVSK